MKNTIVIESAKKFADILLDEILQECNKGLKECGCEDNEISNNENDNEEELTLLVDDDSEDLNEENEEVDEQFNLAKAMKDPRILGKAKLMVQRSGGRLSLKDAVIRVGGSASRFL